MGKQQQNNPSTLDTYQIVSEHWENGPVYLSKFCMLKLGEVEYAHCPSYERD